jgi:molecular chaperone DnaJ
MAAINDAYRVLGDPARRAQYDATLRETGSAARPPAHPTGSRYPARPTAPVDTTPARYPWKLVLAMAALGVTVVLIGAALYEPAADPPPDNLLEPGSCVTIEGNGDAREVNCDGTEEFEVRALVPMGSRCPDGTAGHRDRQGRGLACVVSVP